jgi:hypothetical protein
MVRIDTITVLFRSLLLISFLLDIVWFYLFVSVQMTGYLPFCTLYIQQHRLLDAANIHYLGTSGPESASGWGIDGGWDFALQDDPPVCPGLFRIRNGD